MRLFTRSFLLRAFCRRQGSSLRRWFWFTFITRILRLAHRLYSSFISSWIVSLRILNAFTSILKLYVLSTSQTFYLLLHPVVSNITNIHLSLVLTSICSWVTLPVIYMDYGVVTRVDWTEITDCVQGLLLMLVESGKLLWVSCFVQSHLIIVHDCTLSFQLNRIFLR